MDKNYIEQWVIEYFNEKDIYEQDNKTIDIILNKHKTLLLRNFDYKKLETKVNKKLLSPTFTIKTHCIERSFIYIYFNHMNKANHRTFMESDVLEEYRIKTIKDILK